MRDVDQPSALLRRVRGKPDPAPIGDLVAELVDAATGERMRFFSKILPPWCRKSPKSDGHLVERPEEPAAA
ncbi:hypothetical protein ACFU98_17190 [Streptomyces sp. NPDC057575]|uniref:hypothetical protein n=1 Tax=unclassified Streptomyces TaxID=2593676 RepID=UPI0036CE1352